jgi:hypothetical protein
MHWFLWALLIWTLLTALLCPLMVVAFIVIRRRWHHRANEAMPRTAQVGVYGRGIVH